MAEGALEIREAAASTDEHAARASESVSALATETAKFKTG
jgi:hypothetical protein